MTQAILVSDTSRYKFAKAFLDSSRRAVVFDLLPSIEEFDGDLGTEYRVHRVTQGEVGFLDLIALRYYGPGGETFWWAIARANGIMDPETELYPGRMLRIPMRSLIDRFIARAPRVSA